MPVRKPKPAWMLQERTCPWCRKSFLPRQIKQIYCRQSHRVMHSNKKKADRGDIRVVKVCPFVLQTGPIVCTSHRCTLEAGHTGDHLIRIANDLPASLESKTGDGTHG